MKFKKFIIGLCIAATIISTGLSVQATIPSTEAKLQFNKGVDYWKLGQLEESAKHFKYAIEEDPDYIDAYYNLGKILTFMKQDENALGVFKQIILRKPDDYDAVYQTAVLSKKLGQYDKAKMYLSLIPSDSLQAAQARQLEYEINEAVIAEQNKRFEEEQKTEPTPTEISDIGTDTNVDTNTNTNTNSETNLDGAATQGENLEFVPTPTDLEPEQKVEEPIKPSFITSNPAANSDGIYDNISSPTGIAPSISGDVYIAGFSDNTIYKIQPNGQKIVFIKDAKIDGPIGIAIDSKNNLYIANYNKSNVLKVDNAGVVSVFIENIPNPYCINIIDDILFVSAQGNNSVVRKKLQ